MNTHTNFAEEKLLATMADEEDLNEIVKDFAKDGGAIVVDIGEEDFSYVLGRLRESRENEFYYNPRGLRKKNLVVKISYYDGTECCLRFDFLIKKGILRRRLVPYIAMNT